MLVLSPVAFPNILFIIALLFFALWKTTWIRVLLSVCVIAWGVWAIPFDLKVGIPLIAIGAVLVTVGIANLVAER